MGILLANDDAWMVPAANGNAEILQLGEKLRDGGWIESKGCPARPQSGVLFSFANLSSI